MEYKYKTNLLCRDNINPLPPQEVEGYFISKSPLIEFDHNHGSFGFDRVEISLVYRKNFLYFLISQTWMPEAGYSASGTSEEIVSFMQLLVFLKDREETGELLKQLYKQQFKKPE